MSYKVVEKFVSINGEGYKSGELAVFIRLAGCNLNCVFCDTQWANNDDVEYELLTKEEIYAYIKSTDINNVTLTGGEPLLHDDFLKLAKYLSEDEKLSLEIETNGSIDISPYSSLKQNRPSITMDYKLGSSGMEHKMLSENLLNLNKDDAVKFVVGDQADLKAMLLIIEKFKLQNSCKILISPVYNGIEMTSIVEFMKHHNMTYARFQLQIHKFIWKPETRGV